METPTNTERLVNIQYMSRHKLFLPDCECKTESSLLDSIQNTGGGGGREMQRRMIEAKTGSGEERECLKIL